MWNSRKNHDAKRHIRELNRHHFNESVRFFHMKLKLLSKFGIFIDKTKV